MGVNSEQYGSLLIPIIMAKLPAEIRVQVARNTSQDVWEIDSLLDFIQGEIEAREISEKIKAATEQVKHPSPLKKVITDSWNIFWCYFKQRTDSSKLCLLFRKTLFCIVRKSINQS